MTFAIRHHTEQLHRKATKCAPVSTLRNEPYPEHYEAAYAKAMRALVTRETEGRPTGIISEQRMNKKLRDERVLSVMKDGRCRTLDDVCRKLGIDCKSERENVRNSLQAQTKAGELSTSRIFDRKSHITVWSLSREPHVSCKDRIAAAKAEAHG